MKRVALPVIRKILGMPSVIQTLLLGVVLLVGIIAGYFVIERLKGDIEQEVINVLDLEKCLVQTLSAVQDAESGQRGYLLTGESVYLRSYRTALNSMPGVLEALDRKKAEGLLPAKNVNRVKMMIGDKFEELAETISLYHDNRENLALELVRSGEGIRLMDTLRTEISALQLLAESEFTIKQEKLGKREYFIRALQYVSLFGLLLIIYFVYSHLDPIFRKISVTNKRVKESNEALAKKNEQLEQFAYIASHDLSEPLRTVVSFVEVLNEDYAAELDDQAKEYMFYITRSAKRMQAMVYDLLRYSRLGKSPWEARIDLNDVLWEVSSNIDQVLTRQNATLTYTNLPVIAGHRAELIQLFQQLVLNGITFNDSDQPSVEISVKAKQNKWLFSVVDNGIGIDPKRQESIFGMFSRLNLRSQYEGNGMGLAFCRQIVELHGGTISVQSKKGKGSKFSFTLSDGK